MFARPLDCPTDSVLSPGSEVAVCGTPHAVERKNRLLRSHDRRFPLAMTIEKGSRKFLIGTIAITDTLHRIVPAMIDRKRLSL